jgi:hypothetical protein
LIFDPFTGHDSLEEDQIVRVQGGVMERIELDRWLEGLSPDDRVYVLKRLLPPFLAAIGERRAVIDDDGRRIGDFVPTGPTTAYTPVGMSDEAREALTRVRRGTLDEFRAERAART